MLLSGFNEAADLSPRIVPACASVGVPGARFNEAADLSPRIAPRMRRWGRPSACFNEAADLSPRIGIKTIGTVWKF